MKALLFVLGLWVRYSVAGVMRWTGGVAAVVFLLRPLYRRDGLVAQKPLISAILLHLTLLALLIGAVAVAMCASRLIG